MPNTLTKVLTDLYEMDARPDNPLEFVHKRLGELIEKDAKKEPVAANAAPKTAS